MHDRHTDRVTSATHVPSAPLGPLILRLLEAKDFEAAAQTTLVAMLAAAEERLAARPLAASSNRARLLHGVLHLRPDDSYQRLFGIEHPSGKRLEGTGYVTSANVWRWVSEHQTAVSIDVRASTLRTWLPEGASEPEKLRGGTGLPGPETRDRMIQREVTHVHVVPSASFAGRRHRHDLAGGARASRAEDRSDLGRLSRDAGPDGERRGAVPEQPAPQPQGGAPGRQHGPRHRHQHRGPDGDPLRCSRGKTRPSCSAAPPASANRGWRTGATRSRGASDQALETVRLLSVPEELQMAELFGWRRGAFTGAIRDTPGALARAAKGTLFIDEIDKLSLKAQAGLLQVLEERRYRPLGDNASEQRADVRFIVSTNVDLHAAVRGGRFREDLYYRINVLPVRLPSLDERLDELAAWAEYMVLRRHKESGSEGAPHITEEAMATLLRTRWPGNLRQLDNIVRRAYVLMLADRGDAEGPATLSQRHVEQALGYERRPEAPGLVSTLWRAARTFVDEVERREASTNRLSLDVADAFRGLVLCAAIERRKSRDAAFVLLDQASLLRSRNHHRVLRRELERVRALLDAAPGDVDPALSVLLESPDGPGE